MRGGCHGNYKVEAETLQSRRGRGADPVAGRGRGLCRAGSGEEGCLWSEEGALSSERLGHMSPGEARASLKVFA